MSKLKVCRICLNTDVKMYNFNNFSLKKYYEQIMASKMNNKDGLPHCFCYECAAMLHKFHKFRDKCHNGLKALKQVLCNKSLTLQSIRKVDRQSENLLSTLDIVTVNSRVKTYRVKSKQLVKLESALVPENVDIESDNDINDIQFHDDVIENGIIEQKDELLETELEINHNISEIVEEKEKAETIEGELPQEEIIKNIFIEDDKVSNEQEEVFVGEIKVADDKTAIVKAYKTKKKSKNSGSKRKKAVDEKKRSKKKFELNKKSDLDPKYWLKFNLTEEEAIAEFNAKAHSKKYLSAEFKCTDCLRGFSKEDMLKRHIKLRHCESLGPVECRFCHMRFKWKCFLSKHMRLHYGKFKCLRCDLVCPLEQTAKFHEDLHNGVLRKCKHCGSEFKHLTTYYTHLRTHRSEHVCTLCGESFVSAIGLGIHRKIKHLNAQSISQEGGDHYCERCDVKFETKMAYNEHLVNSSMHVDGFEDLEIKSELPNANPRKRKNCAKKLSRIPTDCHTCGQHFATQSACRKHHLAEHPRTSFFPPNERQICEICGASLAPGSVASHLNTHTREVQYTCNTCGRLFSTKTGLKQHQLTHTSEKPVPCPLCDKRFKQSSSMKLHYRTFHLKEPYPKRNRKKKTDEIMKLDEYGQETDENMTLDRWR